MVIPCSVNVNRRMFLHSYRLTMSRDLLLSRQRHRQTSLLPTSADNVTLLAFAAVGPPCSDRSISHARRAHSSEPAAAAACGGRMMAQTDGQTPDRFIDAVLHTIRAVSITVKCNGDGATGRFAHHCRCGVVGR